MLERTHLVERRMGKGYILHWRKSMSSQDRRTFDRWVKGNAVAGAILVAGLLAVSVLGTYRGGSPDVALAVARSGDVVASVAPR
jgi:hypothetical protein